MPLNSIFSWLIKKRLHQIDLFRKYPVDVQHEVFRNLIKSAKDTEWGKKYNYKYIKTISQFKRTVPLQTYEEVKPYVDRLLKNEQNLLWNTDIKWFAKSSGTTNNKSKYIPVSKEALEDCHYKAGKDLLSMYCDNYPNHKLFNGKHLIIGGSSEKNLGSYRSYTGDLSAIIMKNLPFWVEIKRTPKRKIALMPNWEEKLEAMARSTMEEDVCIISGVPSWTLILLNRILEISGKSNIKEVWPSLELYMHGGVSFKPYESQFKELIPDKGMHYVETYNASEGCFGIQDQRDSDEMLLMLDYGIYYEFIPLEDFDGLNSKNVLSLEDVQLNKNYVLVISTNAGLWRYLPGDTIRFTSLEPYRIQVSGRTKLYLNAFGEEVIIDNTDRAITKASELSDAMVKEYTVAPAYMDKTGKQGAHEWLIEFEQKPNDIDEFTRLLDEQLKNLNSDYEAKRSGNYILQLPRIRIMPNGTFYEWMKERGKLGGQNKVPRLSNTRVYVDTILESISHEHQ